MAPLLTVENLSVTYHHRGAAVRALDGVSLTVGAKPAPTRCVVYLIPETRARTTLALRRAGDLVNLEIDYFAKLISQFTKRE